MVFVLLLAVLILSLLLSKYLFKKWFNHLSIYAVIWFFLLTFYELKLLHYYDLRAKTWFFIISAFITFILGILTFFAARQSVGFDEKQEKLSTNDSPLFYGDYKILKYATIVTAFIGLAAAIQHWMILFKTYGDLANIIINAALIYKMRVEGNIEPIPYLSAFSFVSVFLGGLYTAKKGKLTFFLVLPFLAVVLKELANVSRAGMLFALIEFISVLILFRHKEYKSKSQVNLNKRKKLILGFTLIFILIIAGATAVRSTKGTIESFDSSTQTLNELKGNLIITPSIYLYFSAHVGVLNKYLQLENENASFGENTFMPIYNILSKFDFVERPSNYQKGYFIPMWTNTGTYIREIHADYGITGVLVIPYLLGLVITYFWFKFYRTSNIIDFLILVYLYIIVFFSFLVYIPRWANWLISFVILLILVPLLEKLSLVKNKKRLRLSDG